MTETVQLDAFHHHEVVNTADIIGSMFNQFVLEHVAVQQTPELLAAAEEISAKLADFYQLAGGVSLRLHGG